MSHANYNAYLKLYYDNIELMPGFITPEFILYGYILLLMAGIAVLGIISQRLSNKLSETNNALNKTKTDLHNARTQFAYVQHKLEKNNQNNSVDDFINVLPIGIIQINEAKTITDWNPACSEITGIPKLEVLMKDFPETVSIADREGIDITGKLISKGLQESFAVLPVGVTFNFKGRSLVAAGFSLLTDSSSLNEKSLRFFFWQDRSYAPEIENLAKEIQSLQATKEQISRDLDHAKHLSGISGKIGELLEVGIIAVDQNLHIHSLNRIAENFTGQLEVKIRGEKFDRVFRLTDQKEADCASLLAEAAAGKTMIIPRWTFLSSKNGRTPISGMLSPINLPDLPSGVVLAFRNAETEYNQEAEEKSFISGAAHDLRAPLTTIRGVIELLNDNYDSLNREDAREILRGANESILHLIDLVNDFLNVSRLEQGRITVMKNSVDPAKIVTEVVKSFETAAKKKNLYLNYDPLENPLPKIKGDDLRIKEIVNNLISNAVKYTIRGGVTVKQRVDESMVYLTVEDTGPGIEPDSQQLLFRKFQQVGSARQLSNTKSTGLGLYIAKKFAKLMGGDLYLVRSEPEKGSVFEIKLPIGPPQA
jgi:signal transduction histidine kinase